MDLEALAAVVGVGSGVSGEVVVASEVELGSSLSVAVLAVFSSVTFLSSLLGFFVEVVEEAAVGDVSS